MPRPRTGSVYRHDDHWDCRITLPDGSRSGEICLPGLTEAQARAKARALTELAAKEAMPRRPAGSLETMDAWMARWLDERERRGLSSVRDDRGRWKKWLAPQLGRKFAAEVTKRDLEAVVEHLDNCVLEGRLAGKTAQNTWTVLSKAMSDAAASKTLSLRVREDNPALGVRPPDGSARKSKAYLYPREFLQLVSCVAIPIRWRQLFAIGAYTYARASELAALTWDDVDLEAQRIHIHRSMSKVRGVTKTTKTDMPRRIPIEPALLPLLEVMHSRRTEAAVLSMPPREDIPQRLRKYLEWAGISRPELYVNDATRKQVGFHDAGRATGITWMALRGDEPLRIQQRAGHRDFQTTQGYIREAENLEHNVGEPFPPLPAELLESSAESSETPSDWGQVGGFMRQSRGVPSGIRTRVKSQKREETSVFVSAAPSASTRENAAICESQVEPTKAGDKKTRLARWLLEAIAAGDLDSARMVHRMLGERLAEGQLRPVKGGRSA